MIEDVRSIASSGSWGLASMMSCALLDCRSLISECRVHKGVKVSGNTKSIFELVKSYRSLEVYIQFGTHSNTNGELGPKERTRGTERTRRQKEQGK